MTFTTTEAAGRIDVKCDTCRESVNASNTPFGRAVADHFPLMHKCPKSTRRAKEKARPSNGETDRSERRT